MHPGATTVMSNTRKMRGPRNQFFNRLQAATLAYGDGYTARAVTGRTLHGTVLDRWMRSICPDGKTMPHCEHADPRQPAVLCTDDPHPMIRCARCMKALAGL